ncbi:MAG TPA: HD domain-containing phosphohydrolase [Kofleriaceae bacterium]|nr:HD domain-containing phosphohydrolase [Kofleriaceae bacterium]
MRLGELLGALSLATDLAAGLPLETSLRTCVLATRLARILGTPDGELGEVRRTTLLRHLGCTAFAHEAARLGGDDHDLLATYAGVDRSRRSAVVGRTVTHLAREAPLGRRLAAMARVMTHPGAGAALVSAQCTQAVALAEDLRLPAGVTAALGQIYERHDGRGGPHQLTGDAIRPAAQILHLAELVEVHHRSHGTQGREAAVAEVRRRRGKHLAPVVADAFLAEHTPLWPILEAPSVWDHYLEDETSGDAALDLDRVASAFGRFADLKSPSMLGHSTQVAAIASAACSDREQLPRLRVAALLHDLGTVSVPNGIWDKPGPLNAMEWERVRLHGYYTQRVLARTPLLADVAAIAGAHHERLDGTGYHRGATAPMLDAAARLIAAADAYQAMREARAHRPALSREAAAAALAADAREGRLCRRAVDAVLGAAGLRRPERSLPAGLTPREVEVLIHLARGSTNKEIATSLGIAVRTANHHIENIYAKLDVTTRAAAAVFAVRHDLVTVE